ncbi:S1C family serine protease [Brachybacterium sp. FME24]|uniref:S1C family serine protease n=1 Tax=Brachybacterium sp. FME24 TaxID=2742605 RepID=UPI001D0343F4|nr:trypsin-like peptidase domain-containing protein [Brachybacterium sp. FME24]
MADMKDAHERYEMPDGQSPPPEPSGPYFGYGDPGPSSPEPWSPSQEGPEPAAFSSPYPDSPMYSGSPTYSAAQPPSESPASSGTPAPSGPAASSGPPAYSDPFGATGEGAPMATAPPRRGPGWGGVTGLIALGMLVSSGVTLGGVVAYDQLVEPQATTATPSTPASGATASPASVSTVDDPDWATVAEQVAPSAVAIQVSAGSGTSQGTGVILDEQGSILTNNHVVDGAQAVQVTMSDGLSYAASVIGTDATTDLAVIRLDSPPEGIQPATFADSTTVAVGQPVMALGTPLGLENTVTTGIISAVDRPVTATGEDPSGSDTTYTSAIQTDAAINPGNSGGPLVDAAGQVVGINSSIAGIPGSSGQAGSIGLGFAIPSNTASLIADQLQEDGTVDHAFVGVTSSDGTTTIGDVAHHGAEVVSIEPDSPAAEAGLREGDLITAVDESPVGGAAALTGIVRGLAVESDHTLTVVRDQDVQSIEITLGARPS